MPSFLERLLAELLKDLFGIGKEKPPSEVPALPPEPNIAAGIRWLHHKKYLLERRIKREATWEEAVAEYKGIFHQLGKVEKSDRIMRDLNQLIQRLRDRRKRRSP